MIDNGIMTRAAGEVEKADVLLVLGASLNSRCAARCCNIIRART